MNKKHLTSWSAAQHEIGSIVERINADVGLARAAMANPLYALEEIGYTIDPKVRREFEDRIRFSVKQVAQLNHLRDRIRELAHRDLDPDEHADVHALLFEELGLPRQVKAIAFENPEALQYLPRLGWAPASADPLEALRGQHELVDALLEYRAMEASEPRLATREFFDAVRAGSVDVRLRSATARFRRGTKGGT